MSSNDGIFDQGTNRLPPTTLVREQWWTFEHEVVIRISSVSDAYSSPFSAEATHRSDRWRPSIKQESTREAAPQYHNTLLVFWRSIVSRPIEPRSAEQNRSRKSYSWKSGRAKGVTNSTINMIDLICTIPTLWSSPGRWQKTLLVFTINLLVCIREDSHDGLHVHPGASSPWARRFQCPDSQSCSTGFLRMEPTVPK
jgi:hypothetical protein